ncbi:MAG: BMP family ABC transporter substrate-binding protein [Clostridiales bacterium]|nr:BMP family ABC transporter substrate-binding protein [Clostridiales bacterium]
MKKKLLAVVLCLALVATLAAGLAACNDQDDEFKIGLILLHDEKSTYDKNFIDAMNEVQAKLGLKDSQVIMKTDIPEGDACYVAAADLVDQGCDIVFANSFGHEDYMIKAAKEFPDVEFCHATGTKAHTENLPNYHNAFASIYEGRYLAGIAAGLKLNAMLEAEEITTPKMGYVGAFPYAEVISGLTSFYLGAKSVCENVVMDVIFTGSWYDENAERQAAIALIEQHGCELISQHADSMGAPSACEENDIPNVSYNGSTQASCPNTYIVSSRINWAPYFEYIIDCVQNGKEIAVDWCGGIAEGSVVLTAINTAVAAPGTQAAIDDAINQFKAGTLHVFHCDNFTVGGQKITSYMADVDFDPDFTADTEVVEKGVFYESKFRSAPYFDLRIDGINFLDEKD